MKTNLCLDTGPFSEGIDKYLLHAKFITCRFGIRPMSSGIRTILLSRNDSMVIDMQLPN